MADEERGRARSAATRGKGHAPGRRGENLFQRALFSAAGLAG